MPEFQGKQQTLAQFLTKPAPAPSLAPSPAPLPPAPPPKRPDAPPPGKKARKDAPGAAAGMRPLASFFLPATTTPATGAPAPASVVDTPAAIAATMPAVDDTTRDDPLGNEEDWRTLIDAAAIGEAVGAANATATQRAKDQWKRLAQNHLAAPSYVRLVALTPRFGVWNGGASCPACCARRPGRRCAAGTVSHALCWR